MATLGFLGPKGTHSEEAALYLNRQRQDEWELVAYPGIYEAIQAVADGEIDRCLVPVENSIEGSINITLDTLAHKVDLEVELELDWAVHNQLMVKYPDRPIKTILSHAQPLAQCRGYLKQHYKGTEIRQVSSTARAVEIVAGGAEGYAAIGTRRAGELYGLTTVAEEIQDESTNCTRFFLLRRPEAVKLLPADKAWLICQIESQRAGSLCEVLTEFAKREVNMTHIESRPAKTMLGEYVFFFELEATGSAAKLAEAIEAVREKSLWFKSLGIFPVMRANIKTIKN